MDNQRQWGQTETWKESSKHQETLFHFKDDQALAQGTDCLDKSVSILGDIQIFVRI